MAKDTWYRVDNVAKVFLASVNERDTRSFRVTCNLKEEIDEEILKQAVNKAAKERPQYQVTILRGFFWHYMEHTDAEPEVGPENDKPCPNLIDPKSFGKLHYKVSYYHNRINLDFCHAIADGNGAVDFFNLIVSHYLKIKYPDRFEGLSMTKGASESNLAEDSFRQYYSKEKKYKTKLHKKKAYHLRGAKLPYYQTQFMEIHMPVKDILAKSKAMEVTLTSYIGAVLMKAIYKDMPVLKRLKPIAISMPVNLRKYYPSDTARNFFNSVCISHVFKGDEDLEEVAKKYQKDLKAELTPEAVAERMYNFENIENLLFIRMVPLFIKNPVVNMVNRNNIAGVTAVLSNLGVFKVPEEVEDEIESYCAFCSTGSLFVVLLTYKDELIMGISSAYRNTQVLRDFLKTFADDGIPVTVYANELME
ncbi:MAG: hypothetical protein IKP92_00845 [Lachnospiraceae bacterium]|nr:hypothetical protein [Lachnospiraceae bacterium]